MGQNPCKRISTGKGGALKGEADQQKGVAQGKEVNQDLRKGVDPKREGDPRERMAIRKEVRLK